MPPCSACGLRLHTESFVLAIGAANLDITGSSLHALVPHDSTPGQIRCAPGGVARNVAENLARLGLPTQLICAVGDDAGGRAMLAQAASVGLGTQGCWMAAGETTGSYTAVLDANGAMLMALAAMPLTEQLTPGHLHKSAAQRRQAALIVLDLNLPAASVAQLLREAQSHGVPVVAVAVSAPKMNRLPDDLRGLQCLILNRGELQALGDPSPAALHQRGVRQIIVTDGARGVVCSQTGAPAQHLAALPTTVVVDVTGAGDAFAAGVCAGLCQQPQGLLRAARLGLHLAALTLQTEATVHPDISPAWLAAHLESIPA